MRRPASKSSPLTPPRNAESIDGLPGIGTRIGRRFPGVERVEKVLRSHRRKLSYGKQSALPEWAVGVPVGVVLTLVALRVLEVLR